MDITKFNCLNICEQRVSNSISSTMPFRWIFCIISKNVWGDMIMNRSSFKKSYMKSLYDGVADMQLVYREFQRFLNENYTFDNRTKICNKAKTIYCLCLFILSFFPLCCEYGSTSIWKPLVESNNSRDCVFSSALVSNITFSYI